MNKINDFVAVALKRKPSKRYMGDIAQLKALARKMGLETNPVGADDRKTALPGSWRNVGIEQGSCPKGCQFLPIAEGGNGACYVSRGYFTGFINKRSTPELEKSLMSAAIAMMTAVAKGEPARLHVAGDFFRKGRIDYNYINGLCNIAKKVRRKTKQDIIAFTYTHDSSIEHFAPYKAQLRKAGIRVRNSDHNIADSAIVFEHSKIAALRAMFPENRYIPCLWQINKEKTCDKCRICFDERYLGCVVVFNPDNKAALQDIQRKRSLPVLNNRVA